MQPQEAGQLLQQPTHAPATTSESCCCWQILQLNLRKQERSCAYCARPAEQRQATV